MKKIVFVIFALFLFFSLSNVCKAASITETKYTNGRISISGTGDGEIQIVLFGLDNSPLYLTTVTAESGVFSITLPEIVGLNEGTYTIKVSDYDGTNVSTDTVEIKAEINPQTSDNINFYVAIGGMCLLGIIIVSIFIYKFNRNIKVRY